MPRQRLMQWGESLRLAVLLLMVLALQSTQLNVAWLAALCFTGAVGTVAFSVATPGLVSSLVPSRLLPQANAQLETSRSIAFASGPALAGALVAWVGGLPTLVLAVLLSACALVFMLKLPPASEIAPSVAAEPRRSWMQEIQQGARFVRQHTLLMPLLITGAFFNLGWFMLQTAYVPYAIRKLGLAPEIVGLTMAFYGVGMLLGALASPALIARLPFGRAVQIGPAAGLVAAACLVATLVFPSAGLAGVCFFLLGCGPMIWTISTTTLRQHITPNGLLGRVSSVFLTVNAGARPIGAALGGWIGMQWGESACLIAALLCFVLQLVVIVNSVFSHLVRLPTIREGQL